MDLLSPAQLEQQCDHVLILLIKFQQFPTASERKFKSLNISHKALLVMASACLFSFIWATLVQVCYSLDTTCHGYFTNGNECSPSMTLFMLVSLSEMPFSALSSELKIFLQDPVVRTYFPKSFYWYHHFQERLHTYNLCSYSTLATPLLKLLSSAAIV